MARRESGRRAKLRILSAADGLRDKWRIDEDGTAARGTSLHFDFRQSFDIGSAAADSWFRGIRLEFAIPLTPVILSDYPSERAAREVAAPELDRPASPGKIH